VSDSHSPSVLARLGAYGFGAQEPVILAALVTGDPLLLIGRSGTGKTFLLNSISEALQLNHRHYNASLLSFDDLVGFPYPDEARTTVRFLETPATVWSAESVLIDEINRCKPEHQNRLFSLVHERRIQGVALPSLRYRWAAMNPCVLDDTAVDSYAGVEPLDPALADRFALLVPVGDWTDLGEADRRAVADPAGEGRVADDGGALRVQVAEWQAIFREEVEQCPDSIIGYADEVTTVLTSAGVRVSPRRARLLARTLLAALIVRFGRQLRPLPQDAATVALQVLTCSLPQPAWGEQVPSERILAAHQAAWGYAVLTGRDRWLYRVQHETTLDGKARLLLQAPDPDLGTLAVEQVLANETPARAAAFALAAFPAAVDGRLPIGAEAVHDLGRIAQPVLDVDGVVRWSEAPGRPQRPHPRLAEFAQVLEKVTGARRLRAQQWLFHCAVQSLEVGDASGGEAELHRCIEVFRTGEAL
jgi:MoxR-like ATPase